MLCLESNPLITSKLSLTNIFGCLITSKTIDGNSNVTKVCFHLPCSTIFAEARKLNIHRSRFSLSKILYSIFVSASDLKAFFSSTLLVSLSPHKDFTTPKSQVKSLSSGFHFKTSLAIRIIAFIAFLSCIVVMFHICTMLLCFLISRIDSSSLNSAICLFLAMLVLEKIKQQL